MAPVAVVVKGGKPLVQGLRPPAGSSPAGNRRGLWPTLPPVPPAAAAVRGERVPDDIQKPARRHSETGTPAGDN